MTVDLNKIKENLDIEDITNILLFFYPHLEIQQTTFGLILPTICHNEFPEDGSMKLYYYSNTQLFHCYTQCGSSFDIYDLLEKINTNQKRNLSFNNILLIIQNCSKKQLAYFEADDLYTSVLDKYNLTKPEIKLINYNPICLNAFLQIVPPEWEKENFCNSSLKKYNIRYSIAKEQAIIPHYDIDGRLIGIRVRNFSAYDLTFGKYMPAKINGKLYNHPLGCNLYGIHINHKAISKNKTALIFESEKSVILCDGWYGEDNLAVATCGMNLQKIQLEILLKLGVTNIILCYDKMNSSSQDSEGYFAKLYQKCREYKNYFNFSFIYDREGIIGHKAAPVDYGKQIFEYLLRRRVMIR